MLYERIENEKEKIIGRFMINRYIIWNDHTIPNHKVFNFQIHEDYHGCG